MGAPAACDSAVAPLHNRPIAAESWPSGPRDTTPVLGRVLSRGKSERGRSGNFLPYVR